MQASTILARAEFLSESYIPTQLVGRKSETAELKSCLAPLKKRRPAQNLWLHGPPGTGKSCIAKNILNELEEHHHIAGMYINCWEADTLFAVLDKLNYGLHILGTERLSSLYKLEQFEKHLESKPFVLILDEIDKPSPREREAIIYSLSNIPSVTLICICNSVCFYNALDSRIRSRLDVIPIEFKPYTKAEILEILTQRAEMALRQSSCDVTILKKIAHLSNGDARIAIQTLKHSANHADSSGSHKIHRDHIKSGHSLARKAVKTCILQELSDHHHLIYNIVREKDEVRSGELWREYQSRCRKLKMPRAAPRTFSLYVKRLEELKLILGTRALGVRGNVRIFRTRSD